MESNAEEFKETLKPVFTSLQIYYPLRCVQRNRGRHTNGSNESYQWTVSVNQQRCLLRNTNIEDLYCKRML